VCGVCVSVCLCECVCVCITTALDGVNGQLQAPSALPPGEGTSVRV